MNSLRTQIYKSVRTDTLYRKSEYLILKCLKVKADIYPISSPLKEWNLNQTHEFVMLN